MDASTLHYRKQELARVVVGNLKEQHYSIKIVGPNESTKYLNITHDELIRITEVLTDENN